MDHLRQYGKGKIFFFSFLFTFLVMGFLVVFFLMHLHVHIQRPSSALPQQQNAIYLPSTRDRLTLLVAVEGNSPGNDTFVLAGFFPDIGYMPFLALPRQLSLGDSTLQQLYRQQGIDSVSRQLHRQYHITIDRVAALPGGAFSSLWNRMGSVDFRLPLRLENPSGGPVLAAGLHQFDGQKALALLDCPLWPGGELQRCTTLSALLAEATNRHLPLVLGERAESLFQTAVNGCSFTSLSSLDYEHYLPAARFMARLEVSPGQPLELSGSFGPNGSFLPDQSSLDLLKSTFA